MSFVGMIIEEVETLATNLEQKAGQIESEIAAALTAAIESTSWVGADRELFHGDWVNQHVPALRMVAEGLRDGAKKARFNAQQQREATAS